MANTLNDLSLSDFKSYFNLDKDGDFKTDYFRRPDVLKLMGLPS